MEYLEPTVHPLHEFAIRSIFNLSGSPCLRVADSWPAMNHLRVAASKLLDHQVEVVGLRSSTPDVVTFHSIPGISEYMLCVYSERFYSSLGAIKTLAAWNLPAPAKRLIAHNLFFRLAADYMLQAGAHGDAARLFCAGWRRRLMDGGLSIERLAFEKYVSNPMLEASLADGGWPVAHELGHVLAEGNGRDTWPTFETIVDHYVAGNRDALVDLQPNARERFRSEIMADRLGTHLLLNAAAGQEIDAVKLIGEVVSNGWAVFLMEECRRLTGLLRSCTSTEDALERLVADFTHSSQRADVRIRQTLSTILDHLGGDPGLPEIMDLAQRFAQHQYAPVYAGLTSMLTATLDLGLLEMLSAERARKMNEEYRSWIISPAASLHEFLICAREFVDRARATNNLELQDSTLITLLNISVPPWLPLPKLQPLDEADFKSTWTP